MAKAPAFEINAIQRAVAATYERGDHAYLLDAKTDKEFKDGLDGCGDGLFKFLMLELAGSDCEGPEDARRKLTKIMDQMTDAIDAVDAIDSGMSPKA